MVHAAPRDARLDLAVGLVALWLAGGILWDSWAHLHVGVESFLTPYHAIFYSAMVAGSLAIGAAALRNRSRGYRGRNVLPAAYQRAVVGIPVFFAGGLGDFAWHSFFGVENRIEAVTSPTHLIIGFGVVMVASGPVRSALAARAQLRTLWDYVPMLCSLAAALEFVHLGTSYAFDPSVARVDAPPSDAAYSADYFTSVALVLYKTGTGVMIVIIQSLSVMGFLVWLASRFRLPFGAMTLFLVLGDFGIAAALANDRPLVPVYLVTAVVGGLVADGLARRFDLTRDERALRLFGAVVPVAYFGAMFAATIALEGTWWNPSLIGGAIVWGALIGSGLTFLVGGPGARVETLVVPAFGERLRRAPADPAEPLPAVN